MPLLRQLFHLNRKITRPAFLSRAGFLYYGVYAHMIRQCTQADVVLFLRYDPALQKGIQHILLLVKKMLLLLLFVEPLPLVGYRRQIQFHAVSLL